MVFVIVTAGRIYNSLYGEDDQKTNVRTAARVSLNHRRNNRRDRGRLVPPTCRLKGTNSVLLPHLLGRGFQKARNFTASTAK